MALVGTVLYEIGKQKRICPLKVKRSTCSKEKNVGMRAQGAQHELTGNDISKPT